MSAAAESEHAGPGEAGRGARVVRRVIGAAGVVFGALGVAVVLVTAVAAPDEVGWSDGGLALALCAATGSAGVGLWRGTLWGTRLALGLWAAQVVQISAGAWAWRWALGPYVHLRFGSLGRLGTAWGIGLQADLRPEYGLSDHTVVAFNPVALGVVVVLGGLLWMRRRALR